MKHLIRFRYLYLFLGVCIIIHGCQKENFNDEEFVGKYDEGGNNNLFKKGKLSDFKHVKDYVSKINTTKSIENNDLNRSTFETQNGFTILEHQDIAIHSGDNFNTYTIPVVKNQQIIGTFTNLVVQFSIASDSISSYLLTYYPDSGYLEAYASNDRTPFSGQVTYQSLDYDNSLDSLNARLVCQNIRITYCNNGLNGGVGETHVAGSQCVVDARMWTERYTICYDDASAGSGSETIEPPEGPRGGGTSENTTNTPNTGSSTTTIPADIIGEVITILNLNELNDQASINWLNNSSNFSSAISVFLYLEQHKNSVGAYDQNALDFIKDGILASVNGGETDFEEQVILDEQFKENDCLKSIYDQLGKASAFNDYLQNFKPEFSVAHLKFKYDENFEANEPDYIDALAITSPPEGYVIDITFNGDPDLDSSIHGQPKLVIAEAFIHEIIHAEIFRKLLSLSDSPHINVNQLTNEEWKAYIISLKNNFPGLYDYFLRYNYNTSGPTNYQHQLMAQHYVDIIVTALAQYDNNSQSAETYEALAWTGLYDTVAWNNLTQTQKQTHINNRNNFIQNATDNCN